MKFFLLLALTIVPSLATIPVEKEDEIRDSHHYSRWIERVKRLKLLYEEMSTGLTKPPKQPWASRAKRVSDAIGPVSSNYSLNHQCHYIGNVECNEIFRPYLQYRIMNDHPDHGTSCDFYFNSKPGGPVLMRNMYAFDNHLICNFTHAETAHSERRELIIPRHGELVVFPFASFLASHVTECYLESWASVDREKCRTEVFDVTHTRYVNEMTQEVLDVVVNYHLTEGKPQK